MTVEKQSKERKKKIVLILMAVAVFTCIIGAFLLKFEVLELDFTKEHDDTESVPPIYQTANGTLRYGFYTPDYETDIFTLDRYLELNRYMTYTRDGVSEVISDENYQLYGDAVHMISEYLRALMNGDAELVNSFYTEEYLKEYGKLEKITMQKIYDIEMEYITERDEGMTTVYTYKISYKIFENDGTFRTDIKHDSGKVPLFYELIDNGNSVKISDIKTNYKQ